LDPTKTQLPATITQAEITTSEVHTSLVVVAAQFRQIVVAPADWADAEADGHDRALPCFLRGRA
jgi:hypothetical protein